MAAVHSGSGDGGFAFELLQPQLKSPLFIPALLPPPGCPGVHYVTVPAPSFFSPCNLLPGWIQTSQWFHRSFCLSRSRQEGSPLLLVYLVLWCFPLDRCDCIVTEIGNNPSSCQTRSGHRGMQDRVKVC